MSSDESSGKRPHYYGGQALIEGVMMRGQSVWACAVRRPRGDIHVERHPVGDFPERHPLFKRPFIRGTYALVDALKIGTRALTISANQSVEEEEQLSGKELGGSLFVALALVIGVFVVLPNVGLAFATDWLGGGTLYHFVEGLVRIALFLAYLVGISFLPDIRRVFAYHGAEHKTIAAWEHGEPLEPDRVDHYSTVHVRCGTNFLVMVFLLAILVYSVAGAIVPAPEAGLLATMTYHIVLRIVLLPVIAGLAYEGLRLGAGHRNVFVRALMAPGQWLQKITTKPPERDMIEVAIRSFEAVVPRSEYERQPPRAEALPSTLSWGPDEADPETVYALAPDHKPDRGGPPDEAHEVSPGEEATGLPATDSSGTTTTAADGSDGLDDATDPAGREPRSGR
ncbi:DUF1385 domain-containing protein [Egibacter rhizosphaerae]|uniref:DUF1385 domain-containing protein n=1 Tax=Egibacter rhizosphaerae TaxID=1670831 RepID=A0A411YDA0_9ACTN|nr:DUF1385 domain-containing protein [Egibacter rhizosphaerae]QBI19127.1 DUF1385 domain-containing protein [Egibacter rhizosphaerae]